MLGGMDDGVRHINVGVQIGWWPPNPPLHCVIGTGHRQVNVAGYTIGSIPTVLNAVGVLSTRFCAELEVQVVTVIHLDS